MGSGIVASTARFYIHDHLYSPVALTDYSGTVLERYEYDAYGNPTIWNADFTTERDSSNYGNPYLFTGRRVDYLDSGSLKIQYNRNRYYDYYSGRWLTHDLSNYVDSMNLYEYCTSQPDMAADPLGFFTIEPLSRPMWFRPEETGCFLGAWMSIALFPTHEEWNNLEDNHFGEGTMVQDKHALWRVEDCCGKLLDGGTEMVTFINSFKLDEESHKSRTIVTGEWIDGKWEKHYDRWAMDYVALIFKVFETRCCTQGYINVTAKFKLYGGSTSFPPGSKKKPPAAKDVISTIEYVHGKVWIPAKTSVPGIGALISKGGITVNIRWNCNGQAYIRYLADADSPLSFPSSGLNTRVGREDELKPGYRKDWHPF